jgi:hypothetical protein
MAEKGYPFTNNATGDGTSGGYTAAEWRKIHRYLFGDGVAVEGNQLAVTGAASPLAVNTGHAVVDGLFYDNTASVNLTVTTPVVNTTGGHVILRASFAAQTVRLVAVRNTDGVAAIPSLTQTSETTFEIRLASFTITTGGVITLTDARTYLHYTIRLDRSRIDGGTIQRIPFNDANGLLTDSSAWLYDTANVRAKLQGVAPGLWMDETDDATKGLLMVLINGVLQLRKTATNFGATETTPFVLDYINGRMGIGDTSPDYELDVVGQIEISPGSALPPLVLGANAQGQRVAGLVAEPVGTLGLRRQGGSATDWTTQGTSTQTLATTDGARVEVGTIRWSGSAATTGFVDITFPTAFAQPPIVFCQQGVSGASDYFAQPASITASGFRINWKTVSGFAGATTIDFMWFAIGAQ